MQGVEKGAKLIRHYGINVKGDEFVRLAFEFAASYATVKVSALKNSYARGEVKLIGRFSCH